MTRSIVRVLLVVVTAMALTACTTGQNIAQQPSASAYDRVIDSGVIRVGYVPYPPGLIKDPNTGNLSGIFYDALEEAGAALGLEVDWVEEVGWGTMIEGLKTRRYDVIGSPVWANSTRARQVDFTVPLFYSGIGVYVRSDDDRFDNDLTTVNEPSIRIATTDGEMSQIIAQQQFPLATQNSLPQLTDNSQLLLDVTEGKADLTFVEAYIANLFLRNNSGSLKNLVADEPIRVFPNTMVVDKGEVALVRMLDVALQEQLNSGAVSQRLARYGNSDDFIPVALPDFYPVALPYNTDTN